MPPIESLPALEGPTSPANARLQRLGGVLLATFLAVALALVYWSVVRAGALGAREDNPRLVEAELRLRRGRIFDQNDVILAETTGSADRPARVYPWGALNTVVGYYSLRHGTAGVEAGADEILRGEPVDPGAELWRSLRHVPREGNDIRLTIDAAWQEATVESLGDAQGAVLLATLPDGGLRVMVSRPGFDPNALDEQFDTLLTDAAAPLLNRATQGQYQPGLTLMPMLLAAAIDNYLVSAETRFADASAPVLVGDVRLHCAAPPAAADGAATLAEALAGACPAPLLALSEQWAVDDVRAVWSALGLDRSPELLVPAETPPSPPIEDTRAAVLGQSTQLISPLQLLLGWASLGNGGVRPQPRLLAATRTADGQWLPAATSDVEPTPFVAKETANTLYQLLPRAPLPGTVGPAMAAEHAVSVLSGPDEMTNGWYLGLAPASSPRFAVVVVVENGDLAAAQRVGRAALATALGNG